MELYVLRISFSAAIHICFRYHRIPLTIKKEFYLLQTSEKVEYICFIQNSKKKK